jgi:hypothetical protein
MQKLATREAKCGLYAVGCATGVTVDSGRKHT